jgi:hypothetical protein
MNTVEIVSSPQILEGRKDEQKKLNWRDSLPIQHLLDVISSILAEEYIMIAKQNPAVFSEIASDTSCPSNDRRKK